MRIVISAAAFAAVLLSGCAGHATPAAVKAAPPPVSTKGGNRFEMTQHGRQMTADDFDAWMKARGIRIAKGPQAAPAGRGPKPAAKPVRATEAKASPARGAAAAKRR